jgi:hypothetical protein
MGGQGPRLGAQRGTLFTFLIMLAMLLILGRSRGSSGAGWAS